MSKRSGYTLDDFKPFLEGNVQLPNSKLINLDFFAQAISATGHGLHPQWGWSQDRLGHKVWTYYFLNVHDGMGYALVYPNNAVEFAICRHQKQDAPDANHMRGWHPGHCTLCGLDMTYDSSD